MSYNFKSIQVVPSSDDFINIMLTKTQRKTPTVVHKGYHIARIRSFYIRKVKFTQQNFSERLTQILTDFPKLDDIHPFYAALMNVLYDKDYYKLALGQINTARHLIDNVGKEYIRLLKLGDSLFRCKSLKRAALGRMCTIMKKQKNSLAYLERVRQHLARLPSIDPNTRTLIICGYPNVGKSSFMNKVTRAEVDVQNYAFTTKSLYVGHMDYKFSKWQVIDTPGILDHPLQEMNDIEMQSVTALAHIRAACLFFVDISEQCGYTIAQQVALFENVKPLFVNKPVTVVLNKIDVVRPENVSAEDKALLQGLLVDNVEMIAMSSMTEEGINDVKHNACDRLLQMRVESKLAGKKVETILNRLHVAQPVPDDVSRPAMIPEAVLNRRAAKESGMEIEKEPRKLERDLELEAGGPGQYSGDWKKNYLLEDDDWKYDVMPEILDGHNVADFIDPDILSRLEELEREEEELEKQAAAEEFSSSEEDEEDALDRKRAVTAIRKKRHVIVAKHSRDSGKTTVSRNKKSRFSIEEFRNKMAEKGIDGEKVVQNVTEAAQRRGRSRTRADERSMADAEDDEAQRVTRKRKRSRSESGFRNVKQKVEANKQMKKSQKKMNQFGKAGEADRKIPSKMPKHMFSGKRKAGKTDRR